MFFDYIEVIKICLCCVKTTLELYVILINILNRQVYALLSYIHVYLYLYKLVLPGASVVCFLTPVL